MTKVECYYCKKMLSKNYINKHKQKCSKKYINNDIGNVLENLNINTDTDTDTETNENKTNENKKEEISDFDIEKYKEKVKEIIIKRFENCKAKENIITDILLDDYIKSNKEFVKFAQELKIKQMQVGFAWQNIIGYYYKFENLGEGHKTGLDIKSNTLKIIMELKNRSNTDNDSARKKNIDKLINYKKKNKDWTCIYAVVHEINSKGELIEGKDYIKEYNGYEIRYLSGNKLLDFIFGKNKDDIVGYFKKLISEITCN